MDQQRPQRPTFWEFLEMLHPSAPCPGPGSEEVKRMLRIIGRFLRAGLMLDGVCVSPPATEGMTLAWFEAQGLASLSRMYGQLKN